MPQKRKAAYKPGEQIEIMVTPWAIEGLLRSGVNNMIVALPKTGKSAINGGFVGAWRNKAETFLGRKIERPCDEVHLIWPDMPPEDAVYILEREGLWEGQGVIKNEKGEVEKILGEPRLPIVELVTADLDIREWDFRPVNLARYRKEALDAQKRGIRAFWCFDCYELMCSFVPGFDENKNEAGKPAREMCLAFAGTSATTMTVHHSNKSGGGTAVMSSSGHASITRPFSTLTQMVWLRPAPQGTTQTDMRVVISQIGRRGSGQLVAELTDEGWVAHGEGNEATALERMEEEWLKLEHQQQNVFDHLALRTRLNFPVTVKELCDVLELKKDKVQRPLKALLRKGLVCVEKGAHKTPGPGVNGDHWWALFDPDTSELFSRARGAGYEGSQIEKGSQIANNDLQGSQLEEKGVKSVSGGFESPNSTPQIDSTPLSDGTRDWGSVSEGLYMASAEVLDNGRWYNGWKITNADNPDDIHCHKFFNGEPWPKKGLRWGMDVRLCQTVTPSEPEPTEPTYDPEELF